MRSKLAYCCLRVPGSEKDALVRFYEKLGMRCTESADGVVFDVEGESAGLKYAVQECTTYLESNSSAKSNVYWKIGLAMHDVDSAKEALSKQTNVSDPSQFFDIGYLCHLKDPSGFTIELLQTTFEKNVEARAAFIAAQPKPNSIICQPFVMGQITLRVSDAEASVAFYRDVIGMKLLSIQPVEQYGFELYFLAFTDEVPPNPDDLVDVANREWCWQRNYTTLELFTNKKGDPLEARPAASEAGFCELEVHTTEGQVRGISQHKTFVASEGGGGVVCDPDGIRVRLTV